MNRTPLTARAPSPPTRLWQGMDSPRVRQAGPEDAALIGEFIGGLSLPTQYLRFFAPVAPVTGSMLQLLSGAGSDSDVLIVLAAEGGVIGHGMAVDTAQHGELASDIGLVIADRWQQRGLGSLLLGMLVQRAAERGVRSLVLTVLPDNARMLGMISRRWPVAATERTSDGVVVRPVIGASSARVAAA